MLLAIISDIISPVLNVTYLASEREYETLFIMPLRMKCIHLLRDYIGEGSEEFSG
jgi:hypothetical protein